jgi:hypothetical protein
LVPLLPEQAAALDPLGGGHGRAPFRHPPFLTLSAYRRLASISSSEGRGGSACTGAEVLHGASGEAEAPFRCEGEASPFLFSTVVVIVCSFVEGASLLFRVL